MTIEEILKGKIDSEEKLSRKELEDLISSLREIKLTEENVDNVIKFLNHQTTYTEEELTKLLISFGEHVSEKLIGRKLEMIGELRIWAEENDL